MAEGWARHLHGDAIDACSAGTEPHGLNRLAVAAMREAGVDISRHASKTIADCGPETIDLVVTVCAGAHERCPVFPGASRVVHRGFDDPPRLAAGASSDTETLPHYRRVRDEIRAFVAALPALLREQGIHIGGSTPPGNARQAGGFRMNRTESACCGPDCCAPTGSASGATVVDIREKVREGYGKIARAGQWSGVQAEPTKGSCCGTSSGGGGGCCGGDALTPDQVATAVGYAAADLEAIPQGANMGLSCGNPTAIASLKPGETVLDLGSGGGFDCFIAGPKVGPSGRVIGVDMTPDMLAKARRNLDSYRKQSGLDNVEFRLGEIEHLPLPDNSVDVVISNCVLNLSPDKAQVWREIARVLKPGGRVAVSDLALLRPLPESVRADVEALVGCIAGAVLVEETMVFAAAAGLADIHITPKPQYIDSMDQWQDPLYKRIAASLPAGTRPTDFITSAEIVAIKPRGK